LITSVFSFNFLLSPTHLLIGHIGLLLTTYGIPAGTAGKERKGIPDVMV
jgi:hypothetical protein